MDTTRRTNSSSALPATSAPLNSLALLSCIVRTLRRALDGDRYADGMIDVAVHVDGACPVCHVDARAFEDDLLGLLVAACNAMARGGLLIVAAHGPTSADDAPAVEITIRGSGNVDCASLLLPCFPDASITRAMGPAMGRLH